MKTLLIYKSALVSLISVVALIPCLAETIALKEFKTEDEAKTAAEKQFPEITKVGSSINKAYMEWIEKSKKTTPELLKNPSWPWTLALRAHADTTKNPVEVLVKWRHEPLNKNTTKGWITRILNFSSNKPVKVRIRILFEDGTIEEKDYFLRVGQMEELSQNYNKKPVKDANVVSASFQEEVQPQNPKKESN